MSKALFRALIATLPLLGCGKETPPIDPDISFQEISGEWSYSASDLRSGSVVCEVVGMTLKISKIPNAGAFSGRASGGSMICGDMLGSVTIPLDSFPVGNGYTFNEFVSFDILDPKWRHEGLVDADSMKGSVRLRNGPYEFTGTFRAIRRAGR